MPLTTLPSATTTDEKKQLCVLLSLLLSESSYGFKNSPQQYANRIYNHFQTGYSFSPKEVAAITGQLEQESFIWKRPFGEHYKLSIDAIVYATINILTEHKGLAEVFLKELANTYHFNNGALVFMFHLFDSQKQKAKSSLQFKVNFEKQADNQFITLLAQSTYSHQLWQALPIQWQHACLEHFIRGQFFNLTGDKPWPLMAKDNLSTIDNDKRIYLNESLSALMQNKHFDELLYDQSERVLAQFIEVNQNAMEGVSQNILETQYKSALKAYRKRFGKGCYPAEITGLLYTVSLFAGNSIAETKQLETIKRWYSKNLGELSHSYQAIEFLVESEQLSRFRDYRLVNFIEQLISNPNALAPLFCLLLALVKHGTDEQINDLRAHGALLNQLITAIKPHQHWLGEQCMHLALWLKEDTPLPSTGLLTHFTRVAQWQRWLDDVSQLEEPKSDQRVIWQLDLTHLDLPLIQAKVQQVNAKGEWTKGRKTNIHELDYGQHQEALTEADRKLIQVISNHAGFGYKEVQATSAVLQALVGFDNLQNTKGDAIELIKGEFIIEIVKNNNDCYQLMMQPSIDDLDGDFILNHSHDNCYQVFAVDEKQLKLDAMLANQPNNLTEEKLPALNAALKKLATEHHISSQREEFIEINNVRHGNCELAAVIKLTQLGIDVNFYVMPYSVDSPWLEPGVGATTLVYSEDDTDSTVIKRDLKAEQRAFKQLLKNLSEVFNNKSYQHKSTQQQFFLPEDISQAIESLEQAHQAKALVLSWDENTQGMKVANSKHLSLNLNDDSDWLSVNGNITLPSGDIYALQTLLKAPRRGSIIEFDEQNSLLLDQRLTKLINRLEGMQNQDKDSPDNELRIANSRALPLYQTVADLGDVSYGESWQQRLAKFDDTSEPILPMHLKNTLRDYQFVGVKWLMQLANWGLNACLADDMGLGKTLQTLCVLQMRSQLGASLVIAPKSVGHNWQVEAERFAPSLTIKTIDNAASCADVLSTAKANDLIIVSYGLLPLIGEQLAEYSFANIVLDEAQAIKNPLSLRAKAAFALNGQFKVALSGTPIENHLGELWSLFNFLMPGFLHTLPVFKKRFGNADKNQQQADILKALIAPFILRRNKQTVLTELPEKTEINLTFALSDKEQALYEATRLNALEQASKEDSQYITILASLTKLRRACIAPQLLLEHSKLTSSKLDTAEAIIEELLENDHQALIFSQFVDVLKLVEQRLQKRGIEYCYLDGSMSGAKRRQQVDKFQNGDAPLFLISLKAGGTGLNLTAADYVLHLDPWWNPAVEQQASDRAHRLGQTRPVTVYRLIAQNTIEEKILQLHEHKQALADKVLAGSGDAGQLSKDQLLALLSHDLNDS